MPFSSEDSLQLEQNSRKLKELEELLVAERLKNQEIEA